MLLYPRSPNSDDDRLELLADPELVKRLRKANPKFFTRSTGHGAIAKILAVAGIVSLVAGFAIEPALFAPHRANAPVMTTTVRHVAPAPPHLLRHHAAAPVPHIKPAVVIAPKVVVPVTEPVRQLQPEKQVARKTRAVAVAEPQPESQAQNEERFWLKAQAEARAKDRMQAQALAASAAAEKAAEDKAPAQAPDKTPVDSGPKITMPQSPVNAPPAPGPVSQPWPNLPGGGPCTPGRGPLLVGGHGLAGVLINAVLQGAIPVHHLKPFGRP